MADPIEEADMGVVGEDLESIGDYLLVLDAVLAQSRRSMTSRQSFRVH